jgi:hypothetical protein
MKRPRLARECPRGHPVGSSADRRLVAVGIVLICVPLLAGSLGSLWIADEAIGPLVTLLLWLVLFIYSTTRARGFISFVEWLAITGCVMMLQLLLDLHTAHLGDIVIGGLHAVAVVALLIARKRQTRSTVGPSALSKNEDA